MTDPRPDIEPMMIDLDAEEHAVLSARLGLDRNGSPRTFEETAELLGRSADDLKAIEARALGKLRRTGGPSL